MDEERSKQIDNFVNEAMSVQEPGSMLVQYILIAEAIDSDGERHIHAIGTDDIRCWNSIGILEVVLAREKLKATEGWIE